MAKGRISIGSIVEAGHGTVRRRDGQANDLGRDRVQHDPRLTRLRGKASQYTRDGSSHGIPSVDLQGHNALQGHFRFAA
jgi:hypothetical protein